MFFFTTTDKSAKFINLLRASIFLFFITQPTYAQDLKFRHLTVKEGLSNNHATAILQDRQGFLWVATSDGLNRYDGYHFKTYRYDPEANNTLSKSHINTLFEDSSGELWIGTNRGGLNKYNRNTDAILRYPETDDFNIRSIFEDKDKNLLIGGHHILGIVNRKTGKYQDWAFNSLLKEDIKNFIFNSIIPLNDDEFCLATAEQGIYILNTKTKEAKNYRHDPNNPNSLSDNMIEHAFQDKQGIIWLAARNGGLCRFDRQAQNFTTYKNKVTDNSSINVNTVTYLNEIEGKLWVGTENGGLNIFDKETQTFQHFTYNSQNPTGFSDNSVWSIYLDRQGRVWVGTFSGGINVVDKNAEKFTTIPLLIDNSVVNAMLKDTKNRLWIGTEGGLLMQKDGKVNIYKHDPAKAGTIPNNPILVIYEDKEGRIWIGMWDGGIALYDEKNNQFVAFKPDLSNPKKLSNPHIFVIFQSLQTRKILIGSHSKGLYILTSEKAQEFINYENNISNNYSISGNSIKAICEDKKGNLWVGTTNGLNLFDLRTGKFKRYLYQKENPRSLSNNFITSIIEAKNGKLWIGTLFGLNVMHEDGKFTHYTTKNGLPNNVINSILEDNKGNLWLSTNNGISQFNPATAKFKNYDESDGLQSNQFKAGSSFKSKDGQLFFGGVNGLNAFYPDSIIDNPHIPEIVLTGLKLFSKPVQINSPDSILRQDISQTQAITLTHEQSVFSLDFVALNFTLSEKNKYAYILEGFEKEWNYVGGQRSATYTNLDAGNYTFRVKASNNDGIWNEEGKSIKINILPPWWATWWFRTILVSIILVSAYSFYKMRTNFLKKQNQRLENTVILRTQELRLANENIQSKNKALQTSEEELRQNMEELETNQEELRSQKEQLEDAFKLLNLQNTKVNDSIRYAQRIQNAILPHENILGAAFAEHFVIFKPKDVVSGDFYWYLEIQSKKFLAVIDCTGHGVPGAFMSMIGNTLLYEIINAKHIVETHLILEELHLGILNALNSKDAKIQDGMDIALCCIESGENSKVKIQFSGAKRPLYYFSNHQLMEVQADKKSIGQAVGAQINYTLHEIILQTGDTLYMGTDGWTDSINAQRKRFGSQQFKEMLLKGANLPLKAQEEVFRHILDYYEQGTEQRDDVLLVGVKV